MTAAILQGLSRSSGIDMVGSITPVDTIAALRALTNAPDTLGNPGLDHPKIVAVDGWATKGDSWQGFLECMGNNSATSATFTATAQITNINVGFGNEVTVSGIVGSISIGDAINGTGAISGTIFTSQLSGTTGGNGVYTTNYTITAFGSTLTSTSDDGATQFADASNRLYKRLWDKYHFPAEWVGMFTTNADNGQLIGRVPKFTECQAPVPSELYPAFSPTTGAMTFTTYPTQAQLANVKWRGFSTVWSCAGSLGASFPSPGFLSLNQVAFDYVYMPARNVQFTGAPGGFAPAYDITGTGLSGFEGISLINQTGITFGIGLRLGGATYAGQITASIATTTFNSGGWFNGTLTVTAVQTGSLYTNCQIYAPGMLGGVYVQDQVSGTPGGIGVYNIAIFSSPITISSQYMTAQSPIEQSIYVNNLLTRPKGFGIGGFAVNLVFGSPSNHTFLTGAEDFILKGGQVGLYYDQNSIGSADSGENMMFMNFDIVNLAGGMLLSNCVKTTFDGGSFDYCTRNGYMSNNYTVFKNVYHETRSVAGVQFPTTAELYAQDVQSRTSFDSDTNFLGLPYSTASLIAFDGAPGTGACSSFVSFNNCQYFDPRCMPVFAPSGAYGDGKRQFVNFDAAFVENIYGQIAGYNGMNMVPALSPGNLMNPDWNFASGTLAAYPGSANVTNQTSVVPTTETTAATNAALLSGSASLNFSDMSVKPGAIIYMSFLDQLSGTLAGIGGAMNFYSPTGTLIESFPLNTEAQVPNFAGFFGGNTLAPAFNTTQRTGWTNQQFAFRAPPGSGYMNGNIGTAVGTVTFNPAAKASNVVLSGGNLTAALSSGSIGGVRANGGANTGLFYCSFVPTLGSGNIGVGLANTFADLSNFLGGDTNSVIYDSSGFVSLNNTHVATIATFASGNTVDMAWNLTAKLVWFRVNGGNWNNNGSADPATNTGGISIAALGSIGTIPYFAVAESTATTASVTAQFAGTYAHAAPAGYINVVAASSYYVGNIAIYGQNTNG